MKIKDILDHTPLRALGWGVLMLLILLPALCQQFHSIMREDIPWLVEAGQRLLQGGRYFTDVYELNFPLSILVYMPVTLIAGIDASWLPSAYNAYIFGLMFLFAGLSYVVLRRYNLLPPVTALMFVTAFICAVALFARWSEFGQRDQMIFMGLVPMALLQLGITLKPETKRGPEFWPVVILGSIAMLIKPHFGMFAAAMMFFRMARQKRFLVLRDADFLGLISICVIYVVMLLTIFGDYTFLIMPDVFALYAPFGEGITVFKCSLFYGFLFFVTATMAAIIPMDDKTRFFIYALSIAGLLCIIPYAVQMKGFAYQIYPAKAFAICAGALLIFAFLNTRLKHNLPILITLLLLAGGGYFMNPVHGKFPTGNDYKNFELSQKVTDCGKEDCSFYMYVFDADIIYNTAYYTGTQHTSRLINLWPMVGMYKHYKTIEAGKSNHTKEDIDTYALKFARMITEDISKGKPDQIFICQDCMPDPFYDFLPFVKRDPAFAKEWQLYREVETFTIDRSVYYQGTEIGYKRPLTFKRYKRKD